MGREIKRVSLDFDWPIEEEWQGFICPIKLITCPNCRGEGEVKGDECFQCKGMGEISENEEELKLYDNWEPEEPPIGDGYQLWETVSVGSPVSPVFNTPEKLATWMTRNPRESGGELAYEVAFNFVKNGGYAPSMIMSSKLGFTDGINGLFSIGDNQ